MSEGHHDGVGERRTRIVAVLSLATMIVELGAGKLTGSMALLADGWHMATHIGAAGLAWLAYWYGRHAHRRGRFAFGPAKVNALAGYTNALVLAGAAVLIVAESVERLGQPHAVAFREALPVAVVGLVVNLLAAVVLGTPGHEHHDHNLRAVYLHVLSDAVTSVLAIAALAAGELGGWRGLDPIAGIVGAAMILVWAAGLWQRTVGELIDRLDRPELRGAVIDRLNAAGEVQVVDVRVWPLGGGTYGCAACVLLAAGAKATSGELATHIRAVHAFAHLSVEIRAAAESAAGSTGHDVSVRSLG